MNWTEQILDYYCERGADPGFWAEPLNAASNLAFIVAACLAYGTWAREPGGRRGLLELGLIAILFTIGIGSFLFHTLATRWAALADVLPIGLFMVVYLMYALVRFLGLSRLVTAVLMVPFAWSIYAADNLDCPHWLCTRGSVFYAPALTALVLVGVALWLKGHPARGAVLSAAALFVASLAFRTFDRDLCPLTVLVGPRGIGSHFLWHMLNATLLYVLLVAAIRHGRPAARSALPSAATA